LYRLFFKPGLELTKEDEERLKRKYGYNGEVSGKVTLSTTGRGRAHETGAPEAESAGKDSCMSEQAYTLAMYRVKAGREDEFVAAWNALASTFSALPEPPLWGTLIRHRADPALFYSFGP
jgi:hypothetical protein